VEVLQTLNERGIKHYMSSEQSTDFQFRAQWIAEMVQIEPFLSIQWSLPPDTPSNLAWNETDRYKIFQRSWGNVKTDLDSLESDTIRIVCTASGSRYDIMYAMTFAPRPQ